MTKSKIQFSLEKKVKKRGIKPWKCVLQKNSWNPHCLKLYWYVSWHFWKSLLKKVCCKGHLEQELRMKTLHRKRTIKSDLEDTSTEAFCVVRGQDAKGEGWRAGRRKVTINPVLWCDPAAGLHAVTRLGRVAPVSALDLGSAVERWPSVCSARTCSNKYQHCCASSVCS